MLREKRKNQSTVRKIGEEKRWWGGGSNFK